MKYLQGNCLNSFDDETGECYLSCFRDVSDAACVWEDAEPIVKEEFLKLIQKPTDMEFSNGFEYRLYEQRGLVIAFDGDIHYFFY